MNVLVYKLILELDYNYCDIMYYIRIRNRVNVVCLLTTTLSVFCKYNAVWH